MFLDIGRYGMTHYAHPILSVFQQLGYVERIGDVHIVRIRNFFVVDIYGTKSIEPFAHKENGRARRLEKEGLFKGIFVVGKL